MSKAALVGVFAALLVATAGVLVWLHLWWPETASAVRRASSPSEDALAAALRAHVTAIASRPHNVSHPAELEAAARYIEGQLAQLGYEVERQDYRGRRAGAQYRRRIRPRCHRRGRGRSSSAPTTTFR